MKMSLEETKQRVELESLAMNQKMVCSRQIIATEADKLRKMKQNTNSKKAELTKIDEKLESMKNLNSSLKAYDSKLDSHIRLIKNAKRRELKAIQEEINRLQRQVGLAMRDKQTESCATVKSKQMKTDKSNNDGIKEKVNPNTNKNDVNDKQHSARTKIAVPLGKVKMEMAGKNIIGNNKIKKNNINRI